MEPYGLYQALQNGHAQAIKSYGNLVLDTIDKNIDLEYLLSAFKYEAHSSNKYTLDYFLHLKMVMQTQ